MRHAIQRAIGALIATGLAAGLLASPAAAGTPTTVYVAHSPVAAVVGGSCATPDFATIQGAVDAASPGTTILVCPGTYREYVTVTTSGLTIKGTEPWKAVLRPPSVTAAARPAGIGPTLIYIGGADGVTIQWLKLAAPTGNGCPGNFNAMIHLADAQDAVIKANRIRPTGHGNTWGGPCGYVVGILLDVASSAWIGFNLVQDFRVGGTGIFVYGTAAHATLYRNSIRFRHAGVTSTTASADGIRISIGATAVLGRNALVGLATAGVSTPQLRTGVYLESSGAGTVVRNSLVRYASTGLAINDTSGTRAQGNRLLDGDLGIAVQGGAGNVLKDNTALGNSTYDCSDDTGDPPANTWTGNTGVISNPTGICTPPAP